MQGYCETCRTITTVADDRCQMCGTNTSDSQKTDRRIDRASPESPRSGLGSLTVIAVFIVLVWLAYTNRGQIFQMSTSSAQRTETTTARVPDSLNLSIESNDHGLFLKGTATNNWTSADANCNIATFALIGNGRTFSPESAECTSDTIAAGTSVPFTAEFVSLPPGSYRFRFRRVPSSGQPEYEWHNVTVR